MLLHLVLGLFTSCALGFDAPLVVRGLLTLDNADWIT